MMSISEGMRLAKDQPPAGFSTRHNIADPRLHRLGLIKMKIDTSHALRDAKTGKRTFLIVREKARFPKVEAAIVCLHPLCAGKTWPDVDELVADHPTNKAMADEGERHVFGWYSPAPLDVKDKPRVDFPKLIAQAQTRLKAAEAAITGAKDDEALQVAIAQLDLGEKNLAALRRMSTEKGAEIVGFLSDEALGA